MEWGGGGVGAVVWFQSHPITVSGIHYGIKKILINPILKREKNL